jgi:hypothetical protein
VQIENQVDDLNVALGKLRQAAVNYLQGVVEDRLSKTPANPTKFAIGNKVLISYPERPTDKLTPRWKGPYLIVETKGSNVYSCKSVLDNSIEDYFVDRLVLYRTDPRMSDVAAALTDKDEYLVDRILSYYWQEEGKTSNVTNLRFVVTWVGYPGVTSIMEWKDAKRLQHIHPFLNTKPELRKFKGQVPHEEVPNQNAVP